MSRSMKIPCKRCGVLMDTARWEHCFDCRAEQEARRRARKPAADHPEREAAKPGKIAQKLSPLPYVCTPAFRSVMRRGSLGEAIQAERRGAE